MKRHVLPKGTLVKIKSGARIGRVISHKSSVFDRKLTVYEVAHEGSSRGYSFYHLEELDIITNEVELILYGFKD